jgi:phosphomannomutase
VKPYRFDPSILREYDIRGIVGDTLTEADAYAIGRCFGSILAEKGMPSLAVGYDGRESSPALAAAVVEGACAAGAAVSEIGLNATPTLYYAATVLETGGGIMVTGSHNPPEYNGFKLKLAGKPFWGADIQALGARAAAGEVADGEGSAQSVDIRDDYVARVLRDYRAARGLKVAWDAGNGALGPAMVALTAKLPGEHILLNENVDGSFPAHHPDPTMPENLRQLQAVVTEQGCDLGIAFDGDGDRIGVVDGQARILWGDQILAILARDLLEEMPGATVIADVKASQMLFDEVARYGGKPVMSATGHSIIKDKMAAMGAPLAGEMSGHIFIGDRYYGYDDALYAALRLVDIVARAENSLAEMRDALPQMINTPEIRFEVPEERKFAIADEVKQRLAGTDAKVCDVDGVRVDTEDGWWLLRASNTQNALVVRCESETEAGLSALKRAVAEQLQASGVEPPAF